MLGFAGAVVRCAKVSGACAKKFLAFSIDFLNISKADGLTYHHGNN
jgi:hypothetical protein